MSTISPTPGTGPVSGATRFTGEPQRHSFSPDQVSIWQRQINECHHPVIVLNSAFQPILLNDVLRARLSEPSQSAVMGQPTAFLWQTICETASRIAADHSRSATGTEIAQAFPVHQRCFVAVGSLIRNSMGQVLGAILNLADLSSSIDGLKNLARPTGESPSPSAGSEDYHQWEQRREQAVKKMARLSRRESQVVELVADGLPNKSIAHELDISVKTIEKHRANATRKLGVGSTAEMVRIAVVAGNKSPEVRRPVPEPHPPRISPDRSY